MTIRRVSRDEIVDMIRGVVAAHDMTLDEFRRHGRQGELVDADLRDLWLIWGSSIEDGDQ